MDFTDVYSSFTETEHVGASGVLGAAATFFRWKLSFRVHLTLEALEECLAGRASTGTPVRGACP